MACRFCHKECDCGITDCYFFGDEQKSCRYYEAVDWNKHDGVPGTGSQSERKHEKNREAFNGVMCKHRDLKDPYCLRNYRSVIRDMILRDNTG